MISIKKYRDIENIKDVWKELFDSNSEMSFYQSYEYNLFIYKNYLIYSLILQQKVEIYCIYLDGKILLIAPLVKKLFKNEYYLFGYKSGIAYLNFIYPFDIDYELFDLCFEKLLFTLGKGTLFINYLLDNTIFSKYLLEKYGSAYSQLMRSDIILGCKYEDYLKSLSKNMKQNIRTSYNRLERDKKRIKLVVTKNPLDRESRNKIFNIYILRQSEKYRKNILFQFRGLYKFFDIGTKYLNKSTKVIWFLLYIDDEISSFAGVFEDKENSEIIIPRLAINKIFQFYSPGIILLNEIINHLISFSNIKKIDFTHGDEKYKINMNAKLSNLLNFHINIRKQ